MIVITIPAVAMKTFGINTTERRVNELKRRGDSGLATINSIATCINGSRITKRHAPSNRRFLLVYQREIVAAHSSEPRVVVRKRERCQ